MKKQMLWVVVLVLVCAGVTGVHAQNKVIKGNVLALVFRQAEAYYEVATGKKVAILLNVGYLSASKDDAAYTSTSAGINYKFYLSKVQEAPRGFYLSPGAGLARVSATYQGLKASTTAFSWNVLLGHQWIWEGGFTLDIFAGILYVPSEKRINLGRKYFQIGGTTKVLGIAIGYAFGGKKYNPTK